MQPYQPAQHRYGLYSVLGIERSDRAARRPAAAPQLQILRCSGGVFVFVHAGLKEFSVLDAGGLIQTLLLSARVHG